MTVAALRKHLSDLADFVAATGGPKAAAELRAVEKGLEPFAAHKWDDFAAFLALAARIADEFRRTGQVPVPPPKPVKGPKTPVPKLTAEQGRAKARELYDAAAAPGFTRELLEAGLKELEPLSAADLKAAAAEVHAAGKLKSRPSKTDALDAIRRAVTLRWTDRSPGSRQSSTPSPRASKRRPA